MVVHLEAHKYTDTNINTSANASAFLPHENCANIFTRIRMSFDM